MRFTPLTWQEMPRLLAQFGYQHPRKIVEEAEAMQRQFPAAGLAPFAIAIPPRPPQQPREMTLVLLRGDLAHPHGAAPPVQFVVTLTHKFPNDFPVITIEQPPAGWRIVRHPNVDEGGQCYLATVTNWAPNRGSLVGCVEELQQCFARNFPFERQQRQQQQQRPDASASVAARRGESAPGGRDEDAERALTPLQAVALGTVVAGALAARAIGRAFDSVTGRSGGETSEAQQQQQHRQRAQDMAWLAEQKAKKAPEQGDPEAAVHFTAMLNGTPRPPGDVIAVPIGFGLPGRRLRAGATARDALLVEGPGAPLPLPPVTAPTPDEHHQQVLHDDAQARQAELDRLSTAPKPASLFGRGLRAASMGARMAAAVASDAKNAVESKVRASTIESARKKFGACFPSEAAREQLRAAYPCSALAGDGTGVVGVLFVTNEAVHFSNLLEVAGSANPVAMRGAHAGVTICFTVRLAYVVSLVRAHSVGHHWLHMWGLDNTLRSFFGFSTTIAGVVGQFASTSLEGTPYERAYNWIDHAWRAAAAVPCPSYEYATSEAAQNATPSTAAASPSASAAAAEQTTCCVCLEAPRNTFFIPCGHVCTCTECAAALRACPLCRADIAQRYQAFL